MSDTNDTILFADFGLDSDSSQRYMFKGSSPYFFNVLKAEDGVHGELTNLKGNRKVIYYPPDNYPWLDANTYFVAWSCYHPLTRNVYYYIFSQPVDTTGSGDYEYDNRLLRFNEDTEVIDTIFCDQRNYFGVDPYLAVKDAFVLEDWLYFNPQTSEPKMIHIDMAYNYTNYNAYDSSDTYVYGNTITYFGGLFVATGDVAAGETPSTDTDKWDRIGDSYQEETDLSPMHDNEFRYAFNVIKHIPVKRPVCTYGTDTDKNSNNVRGKVFRFSHRYKYFDNTYSRYSAFSDVTLPLYDEYYNGEIPDDLDLYNYINVFIPLHSAALIKDIEIIFQETGGDWKKAFIVNRKDIILVSQINYTYKFYNNDTAYEPIDDTAFDEAYDAVPRTASCQEIINKNILTYGYCKEGFDNIPNDEIDVTLTPEIEAITIPDALSAVKRDNLTDSNPSTPSGYDAYAVWDTYLGEWSVIISFTVLNIADIDAGDIYEIRIDDKTFLYTIQAADIVTIHTLGWALWAFIVDSFPTLTFVNYVEATLLLYIVGVSSLAVSRIYSSAGAETALTKKRGFKTGAWHPMCIYYYDGAMRRCDAQVSKDTVGGFGYAIDGTTVYIPMFNEYSPVPLTTAYRWIVNWSVNHLPPDYAKWWRWGYAGNSLCSWFVQYTVSAMADDAPWTTIDITPLQTLTDPDDPLWNNFPNSNITAYGFVEGDRVRIITEDKDGTEMGAVVDGAYDFEIVDYDEDNYLLYVQDFDYAAIGAGEDSLIEIYRPRKSETLPEYFEFGELMPIIEDTGGVRVHGCGATGTQNQDYTLGLEAEGVFDAGDVYHIVRTPSKPIDTIQGFFNESQWYSDFYESDDWDKGRIGFVTSFNERYLNIIRYSNQYLQNTLINGLSTFFGSSYKELNDIYGKILRLIEIGDTLKVYQRKKPSSILIGKTQYYDAEGQPNVQAISDRVLGSVRYSTTDYGTEFPESISRNNRYVYGFDIYNGVMFRDSANGIFPISGRYESLDGGGDYKMESYFKQKAKDLLVSGVDHVEVMTVWDERHKNLYVIFEDSVDLDNNDVVMFHEPSNKWIGFTVMGYTPINGWNQILELDYYVVRGFDAGLGYEFDEDTRFAVFNLTAPDIPEETGGGGAGESTDVFIVDEDDITYIVTPVGLEEYYVIED